MIRNIFAPVMGLLLGLTQAGLRSHMKLQIPEFESSDIFTKYVVGTMGGLYLTTEEFHNLMAEVVKDFPDVVHTVNVGTTFLGE
jgi:hypothetical protein